MIEFPRLDVNDDIREILKVADLEKPGSLIQANREAVIAVAVAEALGVEDKVLLEVLRLSLLQGVFSTLPGVRTELSQLEWSKPLLPKIEQYHKFYKQFCSRLVDCVEDIPLEFICMLVGCLYVSILSEEVSEDGAYELFIEKYGNYFDAGILKSLQEVVKVTQFIR